MELRFQSEEDGWRTFQSAKVVRMGRAVVEERYRFCQAIDLRPPTHPAVIESSILTLYNWLRLLGATTILTIDVALTVVIGDGPQLPG